MRRYLFHFFVFLFLIGYMIWKGVNGLPRHQFDDAICMLIFLDLGVALYDFIFIKPEDPISEKPKSPAEQVLADWQQVCKIIQRISDWTADNPKATMVPLLPHEERKEIIDLLMTKLGEDSKTLVYKYVAGRSGKNHGRLEWRHIQKEQKDFQPAAESSGEVILLPTSSLENTQG